MSTFHWSSLRQGLGYHGILLGGMVGVTALLLIGANWLTREPIAQRHAEDMNASLAQVIPAALHDNDLLADRLTVPDFNGTPQPVYRARLGEHITAVAFPITASGYAGDINLLLGVNSAGQILGVRVLAHKETPGLGDKIDLAKNNWILSFNGLSLDHPPPAQWAVKKDGGQFDQFSGATITPRAVVHAIKQGLDWFNHQHTTLFTVTELNDGTPK